MPRYEFEFTLIGHASIEANSEEEARKLAEWVNPDEADCFGIRLVTVDGKETKVEPLLSPDLKSVVRCFVCDSTIYFDSHKAIWRHIESGSQACEMPPCGEALDQIVYEPYRLASGYSSRH